MHTASQPSLELTTTPSRMCRPVVKQTTRVRVWFGSHMIAEYAAETDDGEQYAVAMQRRFFGLRITSNPLDQPTPGLQPLPARHWWQVPPR